jgi:hypothetical protein
VGVDVKRCVAGVDVKRCVAGVVEKCDEVRVECM